MKPVYLVWLISVAVLVWGLFLALGAYLNFPLNSNPWRFAVVFGCVLAFLGFWWVMLAQRNARLRKQNRRRLGPGDAC